MRFDNGIELEKQNIDITPLIDIIFLLVMFFAVSSSFISGADLQALKSNVSNLATSNTDLESKLGASADNQSRLQLLLDSELDKKRELDEQLDETKQALANRTQEEVLLRQLLQEKETQVATIDQARSDAGAKNLQLQSQLAVLQGLLTTRESELTKTKEDSASQLEQSGTELEDALASIEKLNQAMAAQQNEILESSENLDAKEVLLQKLIAEKAAELNGLTVQLESAESSKIDLQQQLQQSRLSLQSDQQKAQEQARISLSRIEILESELSKFRGLANLDQEKLQKAVQAQEMLNDRMSTYLDDESLGISRDEQKITLQLADKILFASGSPDIKPEGLSVLRDLGDLISGQIEGLDVLVGGHTDNIPVSSNRNSISDNWGLSAARAVNVVRFFEQELGIDPKIMAAVGFGEFRPLGDNATAQGRSRNRRIEIVLLPR